MKYFCVRLMTIFFVVSLQANVFKQSSVPLFTPQRCAGLVLCAGGAFFQSGLKSFVLIGTGLVLVTDNVDLVKNKIKKIEYAVITPAKVSILEEIEEAEKNNPPSKNNKSHKVLKWLARIN